MNTNDHIELWQVYLDGLARGLDLPLLSEHPDCPHDGRTREARFWRVGYIAGRQARSRLFMLPPSQLLCHVEIRATGPV